MQCEVRVFMVNGFRDAREHMKGSVEVRKESWESNEDEMMKPEGSCRAQGGKPRRLLARVGTGRRGNDDAMRQWAVRSVKGQHPVRICVGLVLALLYCMRGRA
jgi:hypothetical protein